MGLVAWLIAASSAVAETSSRDLAPRTELHAIETLTLTDQQFLNGDTGGKPVTISGQLRIAQGSGRLPLVVLQHGSSGYAANIDVWSRHLNALGISTLALDGMTGRDLIEVNSNQALLGRLNFILDVFRALAVVASHPRIDPSRVAIMGFSRGGQASLYASLRRFQRMWNKSGVEPVAYVAFYPDCMTTFVDDADVADRPIRIFGGARDDYNPLAKCREYIARLRTAGRDVELTEYPDAAHAFDNPLGARPAAASPKFQSVRACKIHEEAGGVVTNAETRQPFTYNDSCVSYGPHLGYEPVAAKAAMIAVDAFLKSLFHLE